MAGPGPTSWVIRRYSAPLSPRETLIQRERFVGATGSSWICRSRHPDLPGTALQFSVGSPDKGPRQWPKPQPEPRPQPHQETRKGTLRRGARYVNVLGQRAGHARRNAQLRYLAPSGSASKSSLPATMEAAGARAARSQPLQFTTRATALLGRRWAAGGGPEGRSRNLTHRNGNGNGIGSGIGSGKGRIPAEAL